MSHPITLLPLIALPLLTGCPTGDDSAIDPNAPTWHQDVAPILGEHCGACHVPGGIGEFSMASYEDARPWAGIMAAQVTARTMPPWNAQDTSDCETTRPLKHDVRLSDEQIQVIVDWAAGGAAEGDPATAAPIPAPPNPDLFNPTRTVYPLADWMAAGDEDQYVCFVIDPGFIETQYLTGFQVLPGNLNVVHHALIFADNERASLDVAGDDLTYPCFGDSGLANAPLVGVWAPGAAAQEFPENSGFELPAGGLLVMQVHYSPRGLSAKPDRTGFQMRLSDARPTYNAEMVLLGNGDGLMPGPNDENGVEFVIPAGVSDHVETMRITLPAGYPDIRLFASGTHMHLLGVDMWIKVERANPAPGEPAEECLVQTPTWDFNWQRIYSYDVPASEYPVVRGGDTIVLRCEFDNSLANPFLREALASLGLDAPVDVYLGESTLDEMCLAILGVMY